MISSYNLYIAFWDNNDCVLYTLGVQEMTNGPETSLVILRHHGEIIGRKRFQKIVFLLERRHDLNFGYRFIPYYYGPYSKALQLDIDLLNSIGFVEVHPTIPYPHTLTEKGVRKAEEIEREMDQNELRRLVSAIEGMREMSTSELTSEAKSLMNRSH